MIKKLILILIFAVTISAQYSQISIKSGAFSRMGFGARGIGMGDAVSAVTKGNLVSYYNPALSAFQEMNSAQVGYSFLSLDRSLNFLSFTRKFEFGKEKETDKPRATAGVSAGVINSGVSKIDGRDSQGQPTGDLSTSENQFFLGLSNRFSEKFAIGIAAKFYYYKLYENITSTSIGFDIGAIYKFSNNLTASFVIRDIKSKYEWDTSDLFGTDGRNTEDIFPVIKVFGISYMFDDPNLIVALEFEKSNAETNYLKIGAEYNIFKDLYLRAGLNNWDIQNSEIPVRPSAGFSYFHNFESFILGVDYAFRIEPYSSSDQHIIGINFNF